MKKFTENEIPYEDFERMGFSQEMIDDLPETIMNRLLSGEKTPLLSSSKNDSKDNPMKATIWMSREENGVVTGFYRPYDNVRDYSDFSKSQQKTLLHIFKVNEFHFNRKSAQCFINMNQVMHICLMEMS